MNYYELIYLKRELNAKLSGSILEQAITPYKNLLELFFTREDKNQRLIFSSAPGNIALFADTYRPGKKSNTLNFFDSIYGQTVAEIEIAETDRWLRLVFEEGQKISFRLFSNRANALLSQKGKISDVFKDYDQAGNPLPEPKSLNLFEGKISGKKTQNKLTTLNLMLPREHLNDLIEIHDLENTTDQEINDFVKYITGLLEEEAEFRLLKSGDTTLFPEKILPLPTKKYFEEVNDLISFRYKTYSKSQRLKQKRGEFKTLLKRKVKGLQAGLQNLENADKGLERSGRYEKWGHLLMAHAHEEKSQRDEITVEDLYDQGNEVSIPLKKDLDIAENAQHYYHKSRQAEESYREALQRKPLLAKEKEMYLQLLEELNEINSLWDFQDWEKERKKELESLKQDKSGNDGQSLPFHTLEIDGYTVWIGKNARSNDKLVQQAHKEDVWMHARGVPGSHLVIRMGNEKNMPPKSVILTAASYAAYNSKLKGAKLVPVIVTKKKYVRKPKGSAPGAVLVDKEEVEMVEPRKP